MTFAAKVAWRYLTCNGAQTALLVGGVALGAMVFVFITALIGGLRVYMIERTAGNIAHVTLEPVDRVARLFIDPDGRTPLVASIATTTKRRQIFAWQTMLRIVEAIPGVKAASPEVNGNAFLVKGEVIAPVQLNGVRSDRLDAISPITPKLVSGKAHLDINGLMVGFKLAATLGLRVGQAIVVRSDRGREHTLTVRAIYRTGQGTLDERVAIADIQLARRMFDLPQGISQIELKLDDANAAPQVAAVLARATGLKATSWTERNAQLFIALESEGRTGLLIQIFSLLTIVMGVSSALLLTTYRRRGEIATMRSMGVSRTFVVLVFVLQGLFIGLLGASIGALTGYGFCQLLFDLTRHTNGTPFPIDPAQGGYLAVIALTTLAATIAATLPARAASRIDPIEVLNQ